MDVIRAKRYGKPSTGAFKHNSVSETYPDRGSIHVGCSTKARNPNNAMNTERVEDDKTWTRAGAETIFIALFVVGVKYVNEVANSGITARDDSGVDALTGF